MMIWKSEDAEKATGGKATKQWQANGVSIDTRTLEKGDLYIALKGERFDGHDFVKDAFERGAAAAIVSEEVSGANGTLLQVADTQKALEDMAKFNRARVRAKIIAVTGSVGKTSVKEAVRFALAAQGKTHATRGNLNNQIGLPLSMVRMPEDTQFGVFELGMNHAGELTQLAGILQPDIAVITSVEGVHLEFFDSVEDIARAKAEIFTGMKKGGAAILCRDNPHYKILLQAAEKQNINHIKTFGEAGDCDFKLLRCKNTISGQSVEAECDGSHLHFTLPIWGRHQAKNTLAALAAISAAGGDIFAAAKILGESEVMKGRGKPYSIKLAGKKFTLLDDSYNASPASMKAGLEVLSILATEHGGRAIAVLGDMLELGAEGIDLHTKLAEDLLHMDVSKVFTAGSMMEYLFNALPPKNRGRHVKEPLELVQVMIQEIENNDVVLVKGSNGSHMWKLVEALLEKAEEVKEE